MKLIADDYLISLVGESEFKKNYIIDTTFQDCLETIPYGCYLQCIFIPSDIYGGSKYLFYYSANYKRVEIANNSVPIVLPSCEKDINNCNFLLTLEEVKNIARKENLNDNNFKLIMRDNKILIEMSYCNLNTMENRNKILVDPVNGDIVWRGANAECQGIN